MRPSRSSAADPSTDDPGLSQEPNMKTQKEKILSGNAPYIKVGGTTYQGQPPLFTPIIDTFGNVIGFNKSAPGIPYVKVELKVAK